MLLSLAGVVFDDTAPDTKHSARLTIITKYKTLRRLPTSSLSCNQHGLGHSSSQNFCVSWSICKLLLSILHQEVIYFQSVVIDRFLNVIDSKLLQNGVWQFWFIWYYTLLFTLTKFKSEHVGIKYERTEKIA